MIGILRMFFAASLAENFKVLAAMAVVIAVVIVAVSFRPIPPKDLIACDGTVTDLLWMFVGSCDCDFRGCKHLVPMLGSVLGFVC